MFDLPRWILTGEKSRADRTYPRGVVIYRYRLQNTETWSTGTGALI